MYAALWRILPGPIWARVLILVVAALIILYVLATWVFPWVQSILPENSGTVAHN